MQHVRGVRRAAVGRRRVETADHLESGGGNRVKQHLASRIVDRRVERGGRAARQPRRVTDDKRGFAVGEHVADSCLCDVRDAEKLEVLSRAVNRPPLQVGADDASDAPLREHCRVHASTGAYVEGEIVCRKWLASDEVNVLVARRHERAIVRVDPHSEARHVDPVHIPLMRAQHADELLKADNCALLPA